MKNWYQSKTIWIALLQLAAGLITIAMSILQNQVQLDAVGLLLVGKSLLDLIVRFKTDSGLRPITET